MPFALSPLVAGQLGEGTSLDASVHPPRVSAVEYVLDAPTAEDLIESFPVFLVSEELAERLEAESFRGFDLAPAGVVPSTEYAAAYGAAAHKSYRWLRLQSDADADFWTEDNGQLCVSDRAMHALRNFHLAQCEVEPRPD